MEIIVTVERKSFYRYFTIWLAPRKNESFLPNLISKSYHYEKCQAWFQCNYVEWFY